ncbi:hypothetical protein J5N97_015353 [Dioscorea zingiberensis]|uniref:DUF7731 domain-containing protein n=1 Tax=Dioscorea zingiberensis TaxID=325984 RepID=A0A9D5HKI4_9LILI|nr:hypothetical protein J5N97_015353 [Dioscorea zingiberensis]
MASSLSLKCLSSLLVVVLFMCASSCMSNPDAVGIVAKALTCFNDHYKVYSKCEEAYRLTAGGNINVPPEEADVYCGGPCLGETKLVLNCLDDVLYNFKFYNGASIQDIRHTIATGCGYSAKRGDFSVGEHLEGDPYGDFYDEGNKIAMPKSILLLYSFFLPLWAYYYF